MRSLSHVLLAAYLLIPSLGQAAIVQSSCQTVTGIENNVAGSPGNILVYLSPGISGCGTGGYSFSVFSIGTNGITSTNINSILAAALTAYTTGHQISVEYDNSTASCYGQVIAVGAGLVAGNCP
jgi:hypothetical protein